MSAENNGDVEASTTDMCCANCGKAEIDDIKLKPCDKCDLVKYCSDECKEQHRVVHEDSCKERAAELRDEILFKQPESSCYGDCPICCLPMPLDLTKFIVSECCCKAVCMGCNYANEIREGRERIESKCIFCRRPFSESENVIKKKLKKRIEVDDPLANSIMGNLYEKKGEYEEAVKYYSRASELGDADAHDNLAKLYKKGLGVEVNGEMRLFHLEEASILGHPHARYALGVEEALIDDYDRAVKHWIISSNLGHDESLEALKMCYNAEYVSKDDFAAALRGHHAAVTAAKSADREFAAAMHSNVSVSTKRHIFLQKIFNLEGRL